MEWYKLAPCQAVGKNDDDDDDDAGGGNSKTKKAIDNRWPGKSFCDRNRNSQA